MLVFEVVFKSVFIVIVVNVISCRLVLLRAGMGTRRSGESLNPRSLVIAPMMPCVGEIVQML